MKPSYRHTNEDLGQIIQGLDIHEEDSILAVGSSGEQAFALLEFARQVTAVEKRSLQFEYMHTRCQALVAGDYQTFLYPTGYPDTHATFVQYTLPYFSSERLQIIRDKLQYLELIEGDVFDIIKRQGNRFSKFYLSNVFSEFEDENEFISKVSLLSMHLPTHSLLYMADSFHGQHKHLHQTRKRFVVPKNLRLEKRLDKMPKEKGITALDPWHPAVYRKIV